MDQDKIWDHFQTQGLELFAHSLPRLKFLLHEAQNATRNVNVKILNIGVGDGWLERQCHQQGWKAYALDPSEPSLVGLTGVGIKGAVGYIENIPFANDSFDFVFCSEVIEHLSIPQVESALREVQRVLKGSGLLLGTVPFKENLFEGRVVCPACGNVFHHMGHQQSFDTERLLSLFPAKLRVERIRVIYFADWSALNWKGRVLAVVKRALLSAGVHGTYESIYFRAKKVTIS
ncbi:MAG TPA: class I SAM-dependent methyltransferase [Pyrinomonadaceae bacterium]|nr:class I SAM-dependent methyltransferase [Pyrinomonadaceae bacterium]